MGTFQNKDFDLLLNNVQIGIQNGVFGFDTAPSYKYIIYMFKSKLKKILYLLLRGKNQAQGNP